MRRIRHCLLVGMVIFQAALASASSSSRPILCGNPLRTRSICKRFPLSSTPTMR